jgi:hypothetical protein
MNNQKSETVKAFVEAYSDLDIIPTIVGSREQHSGARVVAAAIMATGRLVAKAITGQADRLYEIREAIDRIEVKPCQD